MNIDLSIIIVSWNTQRYLADCLASLQSDRNQFREIIVVDNASTDGSPDMVREQFPTVCLLQNESNLGYAKANNQGLGLANAPFVLFLNSDTFATTQSLKRLISFMESEPEVGACSPRLVLVDGSPQPYAFGCDPHPTYLLRRGFKRVLRQQSLHDWTTTEILDVDWVSGACLLLRKTALDQTGGFDEHFFMYFEDNDLCLRIRQAGWKVAYYPQVEITHLGGQSMRQNPEAQHAYQNSLRFFYQKHYSLTDTIFLKLAQPFYTRLAGF